MNLLNQVDHPFLVGLEYSFQDSEKLYFVTHFMKGGDLFQHLKRERRFVEARLPLHLLNQIYIKFCTLRAKFYAASVLLGIEHLHSQNIVYRDLKPENVLMDENGYVCLTDFGIAKIVGDSQDKDHFCGTPEYIGNITLILVIIVI